MDDHLPRRLVLYRWRAALIRLLLPSPLRKLMPSKVLERLGAGDLALLPKRKRARASGQKVTSVAHFRHGAFG
jgi:hypothetical protein